MAGYFHEQVKHEGRPLPAASFDTMNMSEPVRDQQFNTSALEQGPHRPRTFETMNLDPPQRGPQTTKNNVQSSGKRIGPEAKKPSEGTPQQPKSVTESSQMTAKVVIVALSLRVCTALSLVIGLALIASFSKDTVETTLDTTLDTTLSVIVTVSFSYFASTKYALAVTILGLVYSIFEIVSMTIRLITGRLIFHTYLTLAIRYCSCC
ncbi:hypothetical protein KP509_28G069800 [Ceratopteris richardii]|uniref:CASP-like protein n=1 Tax=Ceratopteris richardii TaxID=49495 RepID=A0A8T2RD81_CERRI|nr:hypothetical protein KP509_28G069800 [Ceratopteris richardii]KAH7294402.1 hypothetical protein KP509_28G069800 [Ceratopteris richardii]